MDQVGEIRNKIDLVRLIQEYLPLKKLGRNFKANCPFHGEKTPSFVVSPERQIWHCFGCGKGGDCFTFLMEYEHIEFPEALRILAQKAGVALVSSHFDAGLSSKKEKLYALNRLVCEFYHFLLTKHKAGEESLHYVREKRNVLPQTIETFQIGFAPQGSNLVSYLQKKKGYSADELFAAGLATRRGSMLVDFFQNRLMFPLFDQRDNVIGFSGRVLTDTDKTSKYINTKETVVYHKGATFFGMPTAKEEMKKSSKVYLMEGEFDVISAFQQGIPNAVAVKGTALTEDQVQLLSRFIQKVVLCFDMDKAGQEALKRSVSLLEKKGLTVGVLVLVTGKDVDEAVQKSPGEFQRAIKHDIPVYDFLLTQTVKTYDATTIEGKKKIGQELLPFFAAITNEIVKEHYLTKLATTLDTSYETLTKEIARTKKEEIVHTVLTRAVSVPRPRQEVLEEYIMAILLQSAQPKNLFSIGVPLTEAYVWTTASLKKILDRLFVYGESHDPFVAKDFASGLPEELLPFFDTCFLLPLPNGLDENRELKKSVESVLAMSIKAQMRKISEEIREKEQAGNAQDVALLQAKFTTLLEQLPKKESR